jgi:protein ImuB
MALDRMTAMDARIAAVICPEWHEETSPRRSRFVAFARWCLRYSPIVAVEESPGPAALVIDISGCGRVHGSVAALRRRIVRECLARNVRVRIGIGGNPVDALVRAHGGGSVDEAPVEALRIDAETVESLHAVNVRRIGELRALPKPALLARYGMPLLARLEMLEGTRRQALVPVRERPLPAASLECDGPVLDAEAVRKACATLLGQVCVQLADRRRGARELRIECSLAGRQRACIGIRLGMPSRSARHLMSLAAPHLERMDMGMGVERIECTAVRIGRCAEDGPDASGAHAMTALAARSAGELVDTLASRFGAGTVRRHMPVERHLPERAWRGADAQSMSAASAALRRAAHTPVVQAWRPSLLLDPPEPAHVQGTGAASLCWRRARLAIRRWCGPEVIQDSRERMPRRYWRVHCANGLGLWLREQGTWSVEGVFA